jgi:hypothetical protein
MKDIWLHAGTGLPWGGRFKSSTPGEKINVLNLFDVALNLRRKKTPKNDN